MHRIADPFSDAALNAPQLGEDQLASFGKPWFPAAKRAVDVIVGFVLAVLALPVVLLLAVGLAIALRDWPFFAQRRPGHAGHEFTILKLRTLPRSVPKYASKHALGIDEMPLPLLARVLRRTHLDELPQLFLVPLGHMSLVGPRPRLPDECEPVVAEVDAMRTSVRQGCTGLWQISRESDGVASGAPELDAFYIDHACLRLDMWILCRTLGYMFGWARPVAMSDVPAWVLGAKPTVDATALLDLVGTSKPGGAAKADKPASAPADRSVTAGSIEWSSLDAAVEQSA